MSDKTNHSIEEHFRLINERPWELALPAFRVFGNLYFVGNKDAACWLVDSGDGLILFDTGYPTMDALLIDSIWSLGFNPRQITAIIHTHGHYDHFGATHLIRALSGAKTYLGEADVQMFQTRPELSLLRDVKNAHLELFDADVAAKDGDCFTIGNTHLRAVATPGHCPGATSWFFNVEDGDRVLTAGLHGGAGFNTIDKAFRDEFHVDWRKAFLDSIDKLMDEKVDIFLGNHSAMNHTEEKWKRMLDGDADAFINKADWQNFLIQLRNGAEKFCD